MIIPKTVIITGNKKTYCKDIHYHFSEECYIVKKLKIKLSISIEEARTKYRPCNCTGNERSRWRTTRLERI